MPGVIRSSDIAAPGNIPQNWNPFAVGVSTADEFTITSDGVVQELVELQGNMFIYSNSSIAVMSNTGNQAVPLSVRPVTTTYGAATTDAVLEFDGRHIVVGSQDIYSFGGHPGSIKSIADTKIRREFFNRLNPLAIDLTFLLQYQQRDEIWICYANESALSDKVNEALIWNYRNNTWTYRDLVDVVSGDAGPVPGGGLPAGEIELEGMSGDNEIISTMHRAHVNTIQYTGDPIEVEGPGSEHRCSIIVDNIPLQPTFMGAPVWVIEFGDDIDTGTDDGCRLVIQSSQYQERTTDASGNSNYNSPFSRVPLGTDPGEVENYDYQLELPRGITAGGFTTADSGYLEQVVYPIFIAMSEATDSFGNRIYDWPRAGQIGIPPALDGVTRAPGAPMTIHLTSANNAIAVEFERFEEGGDSRVRIGERFIYDAPDQLIPTGTTLEGAHTLADIDLTVADVDGRATHFDFDNELVDRSNSWFFFTGVPEDAVIFVDTNTQGLGQSFPLGILPDDGGRRTDATSGADMDGSQRLAGDTEDGNRRVARNFNQIVTQPIQGLGPGEHLFRIWVPGQNRAVPTDVDLVEYSPKVPRLGGNVGCLLYTSPSPRDS